MKITKRLRKYADYIHERFYVSRDPLFTTCGHPEIELALVRLFECTNERKYLTLAEFFSETEEKKEPACEKELQRRIAALSDAQKAALLVLLRGMK